jgi:hypothetical protein
MANTKKPTVAKEDSKWEVIGTAGYDVPEIDGYVFKWVNLAARSKRGWHTSIYKPVSPSTDIGQKVLEHFKKTFFDDYRREDSGGDYFHYGDMILAYAPKELSDERRKEMQKRADDQLRLIMEEHNSTGKLRYVSIPQEPTD